MMLRKGAPEWTVCSCCVSRARTFLAGAQHLGHLGTNSSVGTILGGGRDTQGGLLFSKAALGVLRSLHLSWRKEHGKLLGLTWPENHGGWQVTTCSKETPLGCWWCQSPTSAYLARCQSGSAHPRSSPRRSSGFRGQVGCSHGSDTSGQCAWF